MSLYDGNIKTDLFGKSLNLYLYIPPSSCHAAGVINGIILGGVHRIFRLCSDDTDIIKHLTKFRNRLTARGYLLKTILPLFQSAIRKNRMHRRDTDILLPHTASVDKKVMLHINHHPLNPSNGALQRLYEQVMKPLNVPELCVCVHRTSNLRNKLTYRRMDKRPGPPTSSYFPVPVEARRPPVARDTFPPHTHIHTSTHTHTHTHSYLYQSQHQPYQSHFRHSQVTKYDW